MKKRRDDATQELFNRLRAAKEIVYDAETSGLDFKTNHVVGHVLSFGPRPDDSFYVPVRHAGGANLQNWPGPDTATGWNGKLHPIERELIALLDRQDLTIVGHNLAFDTRFLMRLGAKLTARYQDTQLNAALLDEYQGKYSLAFCANLAGVEAKKSGQIEDYLASRFPEVTVKKSRSLMGEYWRLAGDDAIGTDYARGDGVTTWQLRDWQQRKLEKDELLKVWGVECRLIPVLARMSYRGIRIDEDRLNWVVDHIESELKALMEKFPTDFSARSPKDVQAWLESNDETGWPFSPTGKPSFNEAWLETTDAGRQVVRVRKLLTLRDSFILPLRDTHLSNGRVHTTYNQLRNDEFGTVTGRLSSSDPNLQQVSTHNIEIGQLHRSSFVPEPGNLWVSTDYSQLEPRLLALYSHCQVLLTGYAADPPIDAHTSASMAANRNWPSMSKAEQKAYRNNIGKRINQTILTGGGKKVLVKYGVPEDQVDAVWDGYHRGMPEIRKLQMEASSVMRRRGYVLSLLGRRARLERGREYVAVNRLLQCGNADIIKLKMVEVESYLASEGYPLQMVNNVHDSIDFDMPPGAERHLKECMRIMCDFSPGQPITIKAPPITVDVGSGVNWSVAKYGDNVVSIR